MSLILNPVKSIPLLQKGDKLAAIILDGLEKEGITIQDNDILVVTQKIISKTEGRYINLAKVKPSENALELAAICDKDPRLVEVILSESNSVLRCVKDVLIVEHRLGFICANAGVDHSNVGIEENSDNIWYLMLPKDPDESARKIRDYIKAKKNVDIGILVIDSHGRAWRNGIAGISIGTAGVPELVDMRGQPDLFGNKLRITIIAAADELAAAASLMMGQADEHTPVVHVRGFPYKLAETSIKDVIRPKSKDLFR